MWGLNPLLLRLHGEISLSLLCLHSSWGSALDLAPPLLVGRPLASVLRPDWSGLKERLIRGLLLTQAGGRERYGMWGKPAAAEVSMTLQQPEACRVFSWGSCPGSQDPGSSKLNRLPGGEVWIVTCACTGFLVAAAALAFHAHLWCPCQ